MSMREILRTGPIELEVLRRGSGRPMLLLHGFQNVDPRAPFLDGLGRHAELIAPSHPGFGHSARPDGFDTVYDLVHLYLEALEALPQGEREVIEMRFGLKGHEARTLEEVGRAFGVTRERIRQIENNTLKKLQGLPEAQGLRDALV